MRRGGWRGGQGEGSMSIKCWHIIFFPCLFIFLMKRKLLSAAEPPPWNPFLGGAWSHPQCNTAPPCQGCSSRAQRLITALLEEHSHNKSAALQQGGRRAAGAAAALVSGWEEWASRGHGGRVGSGSVLYPVDSSGSFCVCSLFIF